MKRLLILGTTIASFALVLYLMGCGPAANNNNTGGNSTAKPGTPKTEDTPIQLDIACRALNPNAGDIRRDIVAAIRQDTILMKHYDPDDTTHNNVIKFQIKPDDRGFKMTLEGSMSYQALLELGKVMQPFTSDTCVRRILFVLKGTSDLKDDDPDAVRLLDSFEWDISCQYPSHPCPGGICKDEGDACKKGPDETPSPSPRANPNASLSKNTNANGNANK